MTLSSIFRAIRNRLWGSQVVDKTTDCWPLFLTLNIVFRDCISKTRNVIFGFDLFETFIQLIIWIFKNIQNMTILHLSVPSVVKGSCNKPRVDRNHTESIIFRSTFLKPVNDSKISILNWFMKLNRFMCFSSLFLKNLSKIFYSSTDRHKRKFCGWNIDCALTKIT